MKQYVISALSFYDGDHGDRITLRVACDDETREAIGDALLVALGTFQVLDRGADYLEIQSWWDSRDERMEEDIVEALEAQGFAMPLCTTGTAIGCGKQARSSHA